MQAVWKPSVFRTPAIERKEFPGPNLCTSVGLAFNVERIRKGLKAGLP